MALELKHSSVLFTAEDGSSMVFLLRPCAEKKRLRPLIEHGGGELTSIGDQNAIRLATDDCTITSGNCLSTRYIDDCITENKLLDMANYRVTTRSKADMSGEIGDVDDDLSHASVIIKTVSRDRKGRKKFSLADDRNIIKFLMEEHRYARMKGNAVWKDMEILKITDHTYQSMKDRFKKQILPNIRSYNIPKPWISALTGLTADARTSPVPGKSQPAVRGFSPLSGFMDGMSTRSSSRSPRQSTPKKTQVVSNHPEPDNQSRSDEPHDPKITKQLSLDSTLETNNTESTSRTGQSKSKATEVLDQSDEDEFDKELYRISVVDTEGDVDTEKTSPEDVYVTNRTVSGSPAKDQNEKAKDKGNLQKVERRSLRLRHGQQSDKRDNPVRSSVLALRSSPRKKISTKSDDSFKKSGSGQRIMSKGKQAMPKRTSPTRGQKRKGSPEKPTGRESSPERSQAASPDRPLQPASPNKQSPAKGSPQKKGSVSTRLRKRLKESSTNNSASDKGTGQDMYVPNPGPQALSDFVMGTDHAGSSQESQAESLPEEGETDLENSAGPDEVKKHCQIIKRLSSRFGLTPSDVLQALWANSGSLHNTVHWILYGVDTSGCPAWSEEDDELLGSTRSEDLNALRNKYGTQRVHQRAAFLEDSSLK